MKSGNKDNDESLSDLPFLKAGLEDYRLALDLAGRHEPNARQAICFMHDALEFLFYEILLAKEVDIYRSGQNTIGFDEALALLQKQRISLPLIGIIRSIQKHRGDAKHHGQTPEATTFANLLRAFPLVFSIISFENFGERWGRELRKYAITPLHIAFFDLYRKSRTHDWEKALAFVLRSLIHKRRAIYHASEDYGTHRLQRIDDLLMCLEDTSTLSVTPEESNVISRLAAQVREFVIKRDMRAGAEAVGKAFSDLDFVSPTIFDPQHSLKITDRLYRTDGGHGGMWSMHDNQCIREVLSKNPKLVKSFRAPYCLADEDCYWSWWPFALFDGTRWQTFHLDEDFRLSSEPHFGAEKGQRPPNFEELVCEEFKKAASKDE